MYETPATTEFCYASLIQPQYPWSYNPHNQTHFWHGVAKISAFLPRTNRYQIPVNPKIIPQNLNRPSHIARQHTLMSPARNISSNTRVPTNSTTHLKLSNRSSAIEVRFKIPQNSKVPDLCVHSTLRDFYICENIYSLTSDERSQNVVNCLKCGALE